MNRSQPITRRGLVQAGLAAGAGLVVHGAPAITASAHPWADLAAALDGQLVLPTDPSYLARATPSALRFAKDSPQAIVVPATGPDVAVAIDFAREQGLPLRIRGGGHGYAGYCTTNGICLDMSGLRCVSFDPSTGTVACGGGVRGFDVRKGLVAHGHWIPAGNCSGVGLAGFVQGGGFGFYQRLHGLGCDSLVEAEIVTADGRIDQVSDASDPELLWALKGGGGGNFGVVTRFRLRTFEVDGPSSVAMTIWRGVPTAPLVDRIADMVAQTGDELTWHFTCDATSPDDLGGFSLPQVTLMCHAFATSERIQAALDPVINSYPPAICVVRTLPFAQSHDFLSGNHLPENGLWYVKSLFLPGPLQRAAIEVLTQAAGRWPGSSIGRSGTGFIPWSGRLTQVAPEATAFVHRQPGYLAVIQTCWGNEDPDEIVEAGRQWAEQTYRELLPHSSGGSYQNWIDPDLPDPLRAYYGVNLPRLIRVKTRVDPSGFFQLPQGIPVGVP